MRADLVQSSSQTIKYWDLRSPTAIASVTLPDRLYTMDVAYPLMVVGTAERHLQIFNLTQPTVPFKTLISPLRWQTRVVRQNFAPLLRGWTKWLNSLRTRRSLAFRTRRDTPSEPSKDVSQSSASLPRCPARRI